MTKRKGVTLGEPFECEPADIKKMHGRDPAYPDTFVWWVRDSNGTVFADETAEGALALAKQYHRMK